MHCTRRPVHCETVEGKRPPIPLTVVIGPDPAVSPAPPAVFTCRLPAVTGMTQGLQIIFIVGTTFFSRDDMVNIRCHDLTGAMDLVWIDTIQMLLEVIIPDLLPCRTVSALSWRRSFGVELPLPLRLVFIAQSATMTETRATRYPARGWRSVRHQYSSWIMKPNFLILASAFSFQAT